MNDNDKTWVDTEFGEIVVGFIATCAGIAFVAVPLIGVVTVLSWIF